MKVLQFEQGSTEWHEARRCRVTGTKLKDVMGTVSARTGLIAELISEEGTEQSKILKPTDAMQRGTDEEVFAIKAFEERTGKKCYQIGIGISDEFDWLGHSPDSLIDDGVEAVEVKNPDSKNAVLYKIENMIPMLETGLAKWSKPTKAEPEPQLVITSTAPFLGVPAEYKWQMVNAFLVNEKLEKYHFCIHDARFISEDAKLYIVTVERSNKLLQEAMTEAREELIKFRADWLAWKKIVLPITF